MSYSSISIFLFPNRLIMRWNSEGSGSITSSTSGTIISSRSSSVISSRVFSQIDSTVSGSITLLCSIISPSSIRVLNLSISSFAPSGTISSDKMLFSSSLISLEDTSCSSDSVILSFTSTSLPF